MADEEIVENEQEKKSSGSKKTILIAAIIAIQVILAIVVVVFVILPKINAPEAEGEAAEAAEETIKKERGLIYKVSDITLNPKGTMGKRFAVFEVALEVKTQEDLDKLSPLHAYIVDRFITYLRTKTVRELADHEQLPVFKEDLKNIANEEIGEDLVMTAYFTRFVLE
jgi:flagellar FliL protein